MAQRNWLASIDSNGGSSGTPSEKVPQPVMLLRPRNTRDPMPAASSPGAKTTPTRGPASPATSMSRNAPTIGEPSSVLIAAKLPAAPMTTLAWAGASRFTRCTASAARPPPMAMSGASGPSTAPDARVTNAASAMPGSSGPVGVPVADSPADGSWPAVPGKRSMASATSNPASTSTGTGHHTGAESKPSCVGRSWNSQAWPSSTNLRKR